MIVVIRKNTKDHLRPPPAVKAYTNPRFHDDKGTKNEMMMTRDIFFRNRKEHCA